MRTKGTNSSGDSSHEHDPKLRRADGQESKQTSRAQLLERLANAGFSPAEAEEIATIEAQRQSIPSPPPLPPRSSYPVTGSSRISPPSIDPSTDRNILVVDEFNHHKSIVAQLYLEFLRTWTANNGGAWLFHRVDSAGLDVRTPWRNSSVGRLDDDAETFFMGPDEIPIESAVKSITDEPPFLKTTDRPFESDQITDRVRTHRFQGLGESTFSRYGYILTFSKRTFDALHTLLERASAWDVCSSQSNFPRIILLEGIPASRNIEDGALANPIYLAICGFARKELGWEAPRNGIMDGGLRTSFLQIQLETQKERVTGERGGNLRKVEERTGCKLYVAKQSPNYGWVVAIVGPKGRLWEAEALVRELRSGEEIEW